MDIKIKYFSFILVTCIHIGNCEIRILDLKVPSTIESGSHNEVILDCEYEANDEGLQGLVVKWFYNSERQPDQQIYQWIPNSSKPQALGFLKDRVDLSYKASNDTNTMYRALRIRDITPDLTGDYTCKVTSYFNEKIATKKMVIYEPPKEFELMVFEESEMVICSVAGIYPLPKVNLYILGMDTNSTSSGELVIDDDGDDDDESTPNTREEIEKDDENGFYNVTSILNFKTDDLSGYTTFICDLTIPDTTFKMQKKQYFYSGGISTTSESQIESEFDVTTQNTTEDNSSWIRSASSSLLSAMVSWSLLQNFM